MTSNDCKWIYTFLLLIITMAWATFTIFAVKDALNEPTPINVIEASGSGVLLGALIAWNNDVKQYWFRKKLEE
uniref:Uncharacterized protein n=2 Tax=viral metagenome TaxID=1070528 RepID=A0A6M3JS34_9ZZZZ